MKSKLLIGMIAALLLAGCASTPKPGKPERNFNAPSLTVNLASNANEVLEKIPPESMMDRFEMLDPQGRPILYVAFTDTEVGALVFVDQKLHGTLTRHEAQAFYSCRGHATNAQQYWGTAAPEWLASLLVHVKPADKVTLDFSGKSTTQSIKDVASNSMFGRIKSFFGMGSNPINIFNTLNTARSDFEASEQYEAVAKDMKALKPGTTELRLAEVVKPEDIAVLPSGLVMSYPSHYVEYFVTSGGIQVIQQPPLLTLAKTRPALFYTPGVQWALCTPSRWKDAVPLPVEKPKSTQP